MYFCKLVFTLNSNTNMWKNLNQVWDNIKIFRINTFDLQLVLDNIIADQWSVITLNYSNFTIIALFKIMPWDMLNATSTSLLSYFLNLKSYFSTFNLILLYVNIILIKYSSLKTSHMIDKISIFVLDFI